MIVDLPHPTAGSLRVMGVPVKLHGTPGAVAAPPPLLGQHTTRILRRLLRLTSTEIDRLQKAGIV